MRKLSFALISILMSCTFALAEGGPPPANVVVDKVVQEELAESQSVIGVLYYERTSEISTEVAGLVESVQVRQGDRVKKGDLLVKLDTEILDKEIALTRTRLEQMVLRINNSRKNFQRLEKIYNKQGVSEKAFDDALFSYQDAQKEHKVTQKNLDKLLIQKKRSQISSPYDGIILSKNVDSGAWVQQGNKLVSLGSNTDLYVRAPVAEDMLRYIQMGDSVQVTINAFDKKVEGKIVNIDPVADVKTKNVFLKINIPEMGLVAQNMSASVYVDSSPKRKLSVLSRAAVVKFQGKDFVYTVKDGKAAIMPVNIVTFMGEKIGVDSPHIVPGMVVVVEGNERLRPDQPVQVSGEK